MNGSNIKVLSAESRFAWPRSFCVMPARHKLKLLFALGHFGIRVNEITGKLARKGACPLWAQSRSKGLPNSTWRIFSRNILADGESWGRDTGRHGTSPWDLIYDAVAWSWVGEELGEAGGSPADGTQHTSEVPLLRCCGRCRKGAESVAWWGNPRAMSSVSADTITGITKRLLGQANSDFANIWH